MMAALLFWLSPLAAMADAEIVRLQNEEGYAYMR